MTWTVWDVVVIALGFVQLALLGAVAWIILGIVRGPAADTAGRAGDVVTRGHALIDAAASAVSANRGHVLAIVADVRGIASTLRAPDVTRSLPINYHTLRRALTMIGTFRRGLGTLNAFRAGVTAVRTGGLRGVRNAAGTSPSRRARQRTVAEQIGIVPPILVRVAPLLPYVRAAFGAWKQMRGRAERRG